VKSRENAECKMDSEEEAHKEGKRNTGAEWKERSIFLKERVKRTLWKVFDKCCAAVAVVLVIH
jgi:hypothetical protein